MVNSIYTDFMKALHIQKVRFLLIGGFAVNLHGIERNTGDFDIAIDMSPDNAGHFMQACRSFGMQPTWPGVGLLDFLDPSKRERWMKEHNAVAFPVAHPEHPYFVVDVLLSPFEFDSAYERTKWIPLGDISIPLVSLEDLLAMKEDSGRDKDIADVYHLRRMLR